MSDHVPLFWKSENEPQVLSRRQRPFQFEEIRSSHSSFPQVMDQVWSQPQMGSPMLQLCRRIKDTGSYLLEWERAVFNRRKEELDETRLLLQQLLQKPFDPANQTELVQLPGKLNELLSIDETYWRQRSRAIWLKEGDKNSKFFHKRASNRGTPDTYAQDVVLQAIQPCVTASMNISPQAPYSMDEVKTALFQMHSSKELGPDGMSPFFFQKYWDLVGTDISNAVIHFLSTKEVPPALNFTHVVLIPKFKEPQDMSQLRPIALCNVIYKIASKVLANRLKVLLHVIIAPEQSAFVPDRLISDNTLVASKLAHYMHNL
ncbi:hypothetical protein M0R45_008719 [Rubus argutus]|uniref:Reverse transcriptase domain-containing protein n=1 Tax=Rubus argutus TaxID=59490 RepID=A0AAW1Y249_RUBAR